MGILNELGIREEYDLDLLLNKPAEDEFPEIGARVKTLLAEDAGEDKAGTVQGSILHKIKSLGVLKDGVYSIDLEKTIEDMFAVMKGMEAQLNKVLTINSHLEKDRNEAKELVVDLKKSNALLDDKIVRMEEELPSKRELQMQIEQMMEERNDAQALLRDQKGRISAMHKAVLQHQKKIANLEGEKRDAIMEIDFLESKLNRAAETIRLNNNSIHELRGEKLALSEKLATLEEQLNEALDDKFRLMSELKRSQKAVSELHTVVSEKRLHAKRSYYESSGERKAETPGTQE